MRSRSGHAAKRSIDIVGAIFAIVLLSPILAGAALVTAISLGKPIIFRRERAGLRGKPFVLFKFRTMRSPTPDEFWYGTDAQRVTRIGRILRSTSIDELPELWNVLRGDMSLVGPRPLPTAYLDRYTPEERRRHEMKPGITGWAVVNGRHTTQFEDRLKHDVWYIDHWSLGLDWRILARTVTQVLRRVDVSSTQDLAEIGFPPRFQASIEEAAGNTVPDVSEPDQPRIQ